MDNCDLERLSVSGFKLCPPFKPDITSYTVTVPSSVTKLTLDLLTSDCGASYKILFGDGSKTIKLLDGLNRIDIEVIAEDGTGKNYCIEATKLSASATKLSGLEIEGDYHLHPAFSPDIYEYSSTVNFDCISVVVHAKLPDKKMQAVVNGSNCSESVLLNSGDTLVEINVISADNTNSQLYSIALTREQIPLAVTFIDEKTQIEYECPLSLTALYRPVSVCHSDPKHLFSAPYVEILTRRSKVNPLNDCPLQEGWKVPERELDERMSNASVKCFFAHGGCADLLKLREIGTHAKECPHKPKTELDTKEVTETSWYKEHFASSSNLEIETKHTLQIRNWEKRLQTAVGEDSIDSLCVQAEEQLRLYRQLLLKPGMRLFTATQSKVKPGDMMQFEADQSPLHCLEQAAIYQASAIKLKPQDPRLHFLLGQTLEEHHYAFEMYGLRKKVEGNDQDFSQAKAAGKQDEILAICKLHGFPGTPTMENQLKALDMEFHQLKEQGQAAKADYIQTLYIWLSKKSGKDGRAGVSDEESCLHRAMLKYLDAWSLSQDNWEYNLHVGRLLLLHGKQREALQHLQTALALRPSQPTLRFYTGLALLQQEGCITDTTEQEATLFLQQGLEYVMVQKCSTQNQERGELQSMIHPLSTVNTQFLRGCLTLGTMLSKRTSSKGSMSAESVYHNVALLAMQGISKCVCQGEVTQQLQWVLLDAHFALLQTLIQMPASDRKLWIAKRCQGLTGLIRLTSIPPCRELLDMQENVCQMGVVTTLRSSQALCLLGLAQLAQHDSDPESERGRLALTDACLSFQASIDLEGKPQTGDTPEPLAKQKWWQDRLLRETEKTSKQTNSTSLETPGPSEASGAGRGRRAPARGGVAAKAKTSAPIASRGAKTAPAAKQAPQATARGRAAVTMTTKSDRAAKTPGKPSSKTVVTPSKSKQECGSPKPQSEDSAGTEGVALDTGSATPAVLNLKSHVPRLGLARALSRSSSSHEQACKLYQEVIDMAPEVHDAYIELADLLMKTDPLAAVDVYCRFPMKPVSEQTFDDAFITGEIVRILIKQEQYDHPQLGPNMISHGKVMGLGCLEKYIDILDGKFKTDLLKSVYAGIHDKSVENKDLQEFFKFKCWI